MDVITVEGEVYISAITPVDKTIYIEGTTGVPTSLTITAEIREVGGSRIDTAANKLTIEASGHGDLPEPVDKVAAAGEVVFGNIRFTSSGIFTITVKGAGITETSTDVTVLVDDAAGGTISRENEAGRVELQIAGDAMAQDYSIELVKFDEIEEPLLKGDIDTANETAKSDPAIDFNKTLVESTLCDFDVRDTAGNPVDSITFSKECLVGFEYPDGEGDGIVDGTGIRTEDLRVYWLDEDGSKWVLQENSYAADLPEKMVYLDITHLSVYCLMGTTIGDLEITNVTNYPNPCDGNTEFIFYLHSDADEVTIRIYTVGGRLIKTMSLGDLSYGHYEQGWDGKDGEGDEVANGVYFYKITAENGDKKTEKTGKLLIIR
ncbi:hypothetical protein ES703_98640 [subsurface metagenome]